MSEKEENESIEIMKDYIQDFTCDGGKYPYLVDSMKLIIRLVEKQQKEIAFFKDKTRVQNEILDKVINDTDKIVDEDYISKDKIKKELLEPINKERQEVYKDFIEKSKADYFGIEGSVLQELNWIVGSIDELLEE